MIIKNIILRVQNLCIYILGMFLSSLLLKQIFDYRIRRIVNIIIKMMKAINGILIKTIPAEIII